MDAISDSAFQSTKPRVLTIEENPSLLTVIFDVTPKLWAIFDKENNNSNDSNESLLSVFRSVIVFLNAHLAYNSANQVAVIAAYSQGIKFLYPENESSRKRSSNSGADTNSSWKEFRSINKGMYGRFRNVDETLVEGLYHLFQEETQNIDKRSQKSTFTGAMSAGLAYTNRILKEMENLYLKSRMLVITCGSNDAKSEIFQYIPIMNCIFSANKIKCPIDVLKIGGSKESTFLQQTTDATNGVYLHVETTKGLIQYLTTALFIDPSLRSIIVKPNQGSVDFRTSCFITGKPVAVGYICSVCLCVMSIFPTANKCPACDSEFDERVIHKLKRKPVVPRSVSKAKSSGNKLEAKAET